MRESLRERVHVYLRARMNGRLNEETELLMKVFRYKR